MSTAALDINDSSLELTLDGERLSASPGYAVFGAESLVVGEPAQRVARKEPLALETRFWSQLDQEPLSLRAAAGRSRADLAYLHLAHFAQQLDSRAQTVVCAVPATLRAAQLSLVLSIARECKLPIVGFIDAAVATASVWQGRGRFVYIDPHLHHTVLTAVDVGDDVRFERSESAPRAGFAALYDTWVRLIARRYVTETRFDPLHDAAGEQSLFDRLPAWLEQLSGDTASIDLETTAAGETHRITLTQEEFSVEAAPVYDQILRALRRLRRAGQPVTIGLSARAAAAPGLAQLLTDLHDCHVVVLAPAAAALAAEQHTALWRPSGDTAELLRIVQRLPANAVQTIAPRDLPFVRRAASAAPPTHVLYRGQAYPLQHEPLVIGTATAPAAQLRTLSIVGTSAGISPHHCSIFASQTGEGAQVVDHSRYGTWLNDEIIAERAPLRAGDRLQLGRPGVTLELIAI